MYIVTSKLIKNNKLIEIKGFAFESIDDALIKARNILSEYGLQNKYMFDGKGNIKSINKYIKDSLNTFSDDKTICNNIKRLLEIVNNIVLNKAEPSTNASYNDGLVKAYYRNDKLDITSTEEGCYNGYQPEIHTNIINNNEYNHLYFYIKDDFGEDYSNNINELYIDVINCEIK